jgi:hypothetical protein
VKIVSALLAVATVFALVGCDNTGSNDDNPADVPIEIEVDLDGKTHTKTITAPPVTTSTYRAPASTKRVITTQARPTTTRATRATR